MSYDQSDLSADRYGYDIVVATSQAAINSIMKEFLSELTEPVTKAVFVADDKGNPKEISFDDLTKLTDGVDPFSIPADADPSGSQYASQFAALDKARFMAGFKAQVGIPTVADPSSIPDMVELGSDTSSVIFNMLCSEFDIVQYDPGGGYASKPSWTYLSQDGTSPWMFQSHVDLRLTNVDSTHYGKLPADVQARIKNMSGTMFSVQQLVFDLSSAALAAEFPVIKNVTPGSTLYLLLQRYFCDAYFSNMKEQGDPMLTTNVIPHTHSAASLTITDFNFQVNPYMGTNQQPVANPSAAQKAASTLNYLCATNARTLPPATQFSWNWIEPSDQANYNGIAATNRDALVRFLQPTLQRIASENSYKTNSSIKVKDAGFELQYSWGVTEYQTPTISYPNTNNIVLQFDYSSNSSDQAGLDGALGAIKFNSTYSMTVEFKDKSIIISQHIVFYFYGRNGAIHSSGNILDKSISQTISLTIDSAGKIQARSETPTTTDKSSNLDKDGFVNFWSGDLNSLTEKVNQWASKLVAPNFSEVPVSVANDYVFPGGKTFAFKNVSFSDHLDLVSEITYLSV